LAWSCSAWIWERLGKEEKTPVVSQGFAAFADNELFGRPAAGFDAGARGSKKRSSRADYSENRSWVFRGVGAAILCVHREGDGEKESEAEECKGRFLH
jgi:hypothetical protein